VFSLKNDLQLHVHDTKLPYLSPNNFFYLSCQQRLESDDEDEELHRALQLSLRIANPSQFEEKDGSIDRLECI